MLYKAHNYLQSKHQKARSLIQGRIRLNWSAANNKKGIIFIHCNFSPNNSVSTDSRSIEILLAQVRLTFLCILTFVCISANLKTSWRLQALIQIMVFLTRKSRMLRTDVCLAQRLSSSFIANLCSAAAATCKVIMLSFMVSIWQPFGTQIRAMFVCKEFHWWICSMSKNNVRRASEIQGFGVLRLGIGLSGYVTDTYRESKYNTVMCRRKNQYSWDPCPVKFC